MSGPKGKSGPAGPREGLSAASTPEQRGLVAGLRTCQARLSTLALETDVRDPQVHEQRVAELRGQRNRLELELQRSMGSLTEVRSTSFDEMQAALPERSVVLDFFLHRVRRPSRVEGGQLRATGGWSERRLSVWITRWLAADVYVVRCVPICMPVRPPRASRHASGHVSQCGGIHVCIHMCRQIGSYTPLRM